MVSLSGVAFLIVFDTAPGQLRPTATPRDRASDTFDALAESRPGDSWSNPSPLGQPGSSPNWTVEILGLKRGEEAERILELDRTLLRAIPVDSEIVAVNVRITAHQSLPEEQSVDWRSFALSGMRRVRYDAIDLRALPSALDASLQPGGAAEGLVGFVASSQESGFILEFRPISLTDSDDRIFVEASPGVATSVPDLAIDADPNSGASARDAAGIGEWVVTAQVAVRVSQVMRGQDARTIITETLNGDPDDFPRSSSYLAVFLDVANAGTDDDFIRISPRSFELSDQNSEIRDGLADPPVLDVRLYPGGTASGWIVIESAEDQPPLLVLQARRGEPPRYLRLD